MAHKVIWSPLSLHQLRQISDYISISSVTNANSTIAKIVESVRSLERFPGMGRRVLEEESETLREVLVLIGGLFTKSPSLMSKLLAETFLIRRVLVRLSIAVGGDRVRDTFTLVFGSYRSYEGSNDPGW